MPEIFKFDKNELGGSDIHLRTKKGKTSYMTHRHDYYEMILYRNCNGICVLNGTKFQIEGNCLFLLTPNDYHKIDTVNDAYSTSTVISFVANAIDSELVKDLAFCPRVWHNVEKETLDIIANFTAIYFGTEKYRDVLTKHLLNTIICKILEHAEKLTLSFENLSPAVLRAMTMALTDISDTLTLTRVAKECNMTPSYFSALFRKNTGKTFSKWLTEIRIEQAKRLIEENKDDLLSICYECGYNTPSQFIKMFKRETGYTPSNYKKMHSHVQVLH